MTYDVTLDKSLLPGLLTGQDGLAKLLESVLNQVLEAQMAEALGAEKYERNETRTGYRNGYRTRQLYTRVGHLTLQVPQTRNGEFSTEIFRRYQRSEQAFVLALMEMVVNGVSMRKVAAITEELCGVTFSKSTVSALSANLDERVHAFNERRLDADYPFLIVDALFTKSRNEDESVVSRAVLTVTGIRADGYREVLGVQIGDTENAATWNDAFRWLKDRGVKGVQFVVSDDHGGLRQAIQKHFQGATWQRCQVHLMRNVLGRCSVRHRLEIIAAVRSIFNSQDKSEARRRLDVFVGTFQKIAPKAVACMEEGFEDAMAVMCLPEKYRKRLRTTNMQERLNEEIRRRERVIRIFPNDASVLRIIGALLLEQNEKWQTQRYFDMDEYHEWQANRAPPVRKTSLTAIVGA
jgi:transposase, mutator family